MTIVFGGWHSSVLGRACHRAHFHRWRDDVCTAVVNPNQRDTNTDGFGKCCDADFNSDLIVNLIDFGIFSSRFAGAPGPSAVAP